MTDKTGNLSNATIRSSYIENTNAEDLAAAKSTIRLSTVINSDLENASINVTQSVENSTMNKVALVENLTIERCRRC